MIKGWKKYKLTLTCLGPVHVGSGNKTTAQDYIVVNDGKTAFFPDMGLLYGALPDDKKDMLLNHLQRPDQVANAGGKEGKHEQRLSEWLTANGISEVPMIVRSNAIVDISSLNNTRTKAQDNGVQNVNSTSIQYGTTNVNAQNQIQLLNDARNRWTDGDGWFELQEHYGYLDTKYFDAVRECGHIYPDKPELNTQSGANNANTSQNSDIPNIDWRISGRELKQMSDVDEFIRDMLTNKPYIPGSSLKGALKTVLKGAGFKNPDEWRWDGNGKNLHPDNLRVSDSELIDSKSLIICSKWDEVATKGTYQKLPDIVSKTKDGSEFHTKPVNPHELNSLKRQCLKPGTEVEFEITVVNNDNFANLLTDATKNWYKKYRDEYASKFVNIKNSNDEAVLYLGGGAGFLTKTDWMIDENDAQKRSEQVQDILNEQFDNKEASQARNHKNMYDTEQICSCEKQHNHKCGPLCRKYKLQQKHQNKKYPGQIVNDLKDFGACPRCFKLAKIEQKFYEMGKCKIEIEEI